MLHFGSLKTRIIVLTTVPLSLLFITTLLGINHTANNVVRANVRKSLSDAGSVFIQLISTRKHGLLTMATVTARDPRFFATFSIPRHERGPEFGPTLEGVSLDFLRITTADFLEVFDADGNLISHVDSRGRARRGSVIHGIDGLQEATKGYAITDFYRVAERPVVAALVPVYVSEQLEAIVRLGTYLDDRFATEVKRLTGAHVSMMVDSAEVSTTFPNVPPSPDWPPQQSSITFAQESVTQSDAVTARRGGTQYLAIHIGLNGVNADEGFDVYIARELRTELAPILALEKRMALAGLLAVVITVLAGFVLAASVTKPLSRVVQAASAIKEGRYDHPLEISGRDEVADMARIFDEMRAALGNYVTRLKNIDQLKSNFIALAGHELRTPLTIITGFNELIMSGSLGAIPDNIKETMQHIQKQLGDLNGQVQKILDMSSVEQGLLELHIEEADLRGLVVAGIETRRSALESRQLELVIRLPDDPLMMQIDPHRVEQSFLNLLDNAIRFTPDGGTVTVALQKGEQKIRLSIKDTGVGIHPNEIEWIFRKIYDADEILHHTSGLHRFGSRGFGLGLALTKALVEKHGGKILVKSTLGRGSEFTIVLDATSPAPVRELQPAS